MLRRQVPGLDRLPRDGLHHAALENLKLHKGNQFTVCTGLQCVQVCSKNNPIMKLSRHAHFVLVSSLLDELVHYFLRLSVTFLLQVSYECVQVARTVIRLYNRLMSLDDASNTCKHTPTH